MDNLITKVCSLPPTITSLCPITQQTWSESMLSVRGAKPGSDKKELLSNMSYLILASAVHASQTVSNQLNPLFCK